MKKLDLSILAFLILIPLCTTGLYANGASFYPGLNGKNAIPYNIRGVQLVSESIHIHRLNTVCSFKLVNLNRKAVKFTMGFPFNIPNSTLAMTVDAKLLNNVYKINDF